MRGLSAVVVAAVAAAGCAREADTGFPSIAPSHLGLSAEAAGAAEPVAAAGVNPSVRHVGSNKVLGAMAFQKVTGRSVDPERLNGAK